MQNTTVLMDRSKGRVSPNVGLTAINLCPAPNTQVFYVGKRWQRRLGISTGRVGIVDTTPIAKSGAVSVSFARIPSKDAPADSENEERSPEAYLLDPRNLRVVPPAVIAKKEAARAASASAILQQQQS